MIEEKDKVTITAPAYSGPNRRCDERRKAVDRRDMIRFEPDKNPRRSGKDRRQAVEDTWERRDI
ncbi:hypothetical protein MNBD_GAMMA22-476 [hydrothermal vent metagenome]|uniref:Uncharacterized protein n=1 Tax=hydrothermal vent metagenome TaxID=652676 RepID=A0A3B0ZXY4_9ZZZZ